MNRQLVTVAEFRNLTAAHLLRSRLEAEGILVFLQDEYVTSMRGLRMSGISKAALRVPADQLEHAQAILSRFEPPAGKRSHAELPAKGYWTVKRAVLIAWIVFLLLGILLRHGCRPG